MAAGPDRYEALRETARTVEKRNLEAQQPEEQTEPSAATQGASDELSTQQTEPEPPLDAPTRPIALPHQSPGWTGDPGFEAQVASANNWHNWANAVEKERFLATEQGEKTHEPAQQPDAPPTSPPSQDQTRTDDDLSNGHAQAAQPTQPNDGQGKETPEREADAKKPALTFNWDQDQSLEHER